MKSKTARSAVLAIEPEIATHQIGECLLKKVEIPLDSEGE